MYLRGRAWGRFIIELLDGSEELLGGRGIPIWYAIDSILQKAVQVVSTGCF
jgi:hypothetical protein